MSESYCSYEVSKLLKKKGFNEPCRSYFIDNVDYIDSSYSIDELTDLNMGVWETLRPTHQMVCAWLREVHDLYIEVVRGYEYFFISVDKMHPFMEFSIKDDTFDDYDEAVEAAIKYCLENLI